MNYEDEIKALLDSPSKLIMKEPFKRGGHLKRTPSRTRCNIGDAFEANLPNFEYEIVTQEQFMRELDPNCHDVMFDENLPSICVKLKDGYYEIKQQRTPVAFQHRIM